MHTIRDKCEEVLDIESLCGTQQTTAHTETMVYYPAMEQNAGASERVEVQTQYLQFSYYLVEGIEDIRHHQSPLDFLI